MSFFAAGAKSADELAKVKAGLDGGGSLPAEYLWYFVLGLVFIVLASALISAVRRRRFGAMFRGWAAINDPDRIAVIFKRAADRQAQCTLEIFDHHHSGVYRGKVYEARPGSRLVLELSAPPGQGVDFDGFPAQVHLNFRPAPNEDMEHYQFSSHTQAIDYQREKNWRAVRVTLAWPECVISAQRRDFLRLEPLGQHAMKAGIYRIPNEFSGQTDRLEPVAEGGVSDLSVGGMLLLFDGISQMRDHQNYLAVLDLPMAELDLELKNTRLFLLFQVLSRDIIHPSDEGKPTRTLIRGNFAGRYRLQADTGLWRSVGFSPEAFQDLAHWVNAYQRHLLKKEKGLTAAPVSRINIFRPRPPQRPGPKNDDRR